MRVLIVALLVAASLAGCTAQTPTPSDGGSLPFESRPLETDGLSNQTLEASRPAVGAVQLANVTRDDWFVLPLAATAEGTAAGFRLPVPNGALVPAWYDHKQTHLVLEIAVLGDGHVEALHLEVGQSGTVGAELTEFSGDPGFGAGVNERGYAAGDLSGQYIDFEADEGTPMFVVAGAIGSGDATLGLRFAPKDPFDGDYTPPVDDGAAFLASEKGRAGLFVAPIAQASGLQVGLFYDYHSLVLPGSSRFTFGDIEVTEPIPNTPAQAVLNLAIHAERPAGGSSSNTVWLWTEAHIGMVDSTVTTPGGQTATVQGPLVPDPIVSGTVLLARGEGTQAASTDLTLQGVGSAGEFPQLTVVAQVHFDATLSSLAGEKIDGYAEAYSALPIGVHGDSIRLGGENGSIVFAMPRT